MAQTENTPNDAADALANIDWDELDAKNPQLAKVMRALREERNDLLAKVDAKAAERKSRAPKEVLERLNGALTKEPTGINKDAVTFLMTGESPAGSADTTELLDWFQKLLELCPGVTVDRKKLAMDEHFVQGILRLYNLPETRSITPAKSRGENGGDDAAAAVAASDEDDNED